MQKQNGGVFQQRQTNGGRNVVDGRNNNNNNVAGLGLSSSAWPTLQHAQQQPLQNPQPCFPVRAVFLGNGYGSSTGTGVFLPRPVESRNSTKKQPGDYFLIMMMLILSCLFKNLSCTFFCVFGSNV